MDQFIGEIRVFAGNFEPRGWAFCNGQLLPIAQNTALFSILGTLYGGDGKTTFALPDLQGRVPLGQGSGPGLTPRSVGGRAGETSVTLVPSQMPQHTHDAQCGDTSNQGAASGNVWSNAGRGVPAAYAAGPDASMPPDTVQLAGGSQPHNNQQPYLGLSFIIALQGEYPQRS